jgi:hypothetical protein
MHKPFVALVLFVSFGSAPPVLATEPGTPMDCSDLELAPGLTCTTLVEAGAGVFFPAAAAAVLDNEGRILQRSGGSTFDILEVIGTCGTRSLVRTALLYGIAENGSRSPLVTGRWRCLDGATGRLESVGFSTLLFDAVRGSLLVGASSGCSDRFFADCPAYGGGGWLARIDGFTPLADVLPPPPLPAPLCSNGLDDDGDGQIDAADAHCKSGADNDESRP